MHNLDWHEGAPDKLVPGMIVEFYGELAIIGHFDCELSDGHPRDCDYKEWFASIERWAWVIKPCQLEWLESMNKQHGKGKK